MKALFLKTLVIVLLAVGFASCRAHKPVVTAHPRHLPPGHAKKIYGHRSAKAFAPGQRKKAGTTVIVVKQKPRKKGKMH